MGGEQVLDLSDLQGGQASQDVGEIFLRVQATPPATNGDWLFCLVVLMNGRRRLAHRYRVLGPSPFDRIPSGLGIAF